MLSISFLFVSFVAGVFTVLAPCVLPILPIMFGTAVQGGDKKRPIVVVGALMVSVFLFTLILKFSSVFIMVPPSVWTTISAVIFVALGLGMLFPDMYAKGMLALGFEQKSNELLNSSFKKKGIIGDIFLGASLGPIFSTCSPTYFVILSTVLPQSLSVGIIYLLAYTLGLGAVFYTIVRVGERLIQKLEWSANPKGILKRVIGGLLVFLGLLVLTGADKSIETFLINNGFSATSIEQTLLQKIGN